MEVVTGNLLRKASTLDAQILEEVPSLGKFKHQIEDKNFPAVYKTDIISIQIVLHKLDDIRML